jgi:hypothetical protein
MNGPAEIVGPLLLARRDTAQPHALAGAFSVPLTIGPNEIITIGPGGSLQGNTIVGQVLVTPPPVPPSPGAPVPLGMVASPGLAGTSGIQPQLNVYLLRDSLGLSDVLAFTD